MLQSKETAFSKTVRSRIVLTIGLFVLFLGTPLFLYTTRVHRAELPVSLLNERIQSFGESVSFNIPIYINSTNSEVLEAAQAAADRYVATQTNLGLLWAINFHPYAYDIDSYKHYVLTLIVDDKANDGEATHSYILSPYSEGITVISPPSADLETVANYITEVLFNKVFNAEIATLSLLSNDAVKSDMSFPYSTEYNVVFNLFIQDGSPVEWEIEEVVSLMRPIFQALKHYCKFKVSTQVQYYSKLTHEPVYDEELKANVLSKEDLSTFINFGDWNLNNHEKTPSINFIIYFSDLNYKNVPLLVSGSKTNSFSIPQWGGVHIYNPSMPLLEGTNAKISSKELNKILDIFASQLFKLLGVPTTPVSPLMRINSFQRISCLKSMRRSLDNLSALVKLSNSLLGISIPEATKSNVLNSLTYYDKAVEKLETSDFAMALENAGKSLHFSDKAFFEKEMLQQAHFPNEHKLAVFLPLLGPICSIVLFGVIKRFKAWREEKRKLSQKEKEKKDI